MITRPAILFACFGWFVAGQPLYAVTRPPVSYGRDIPPLLSDKSYRRHRPDAKARQAKLRLDTREGLASKVIVAGNPDKSEPVTLSSSDDDDERMPPPESKLSLT